MKKNLARKEKNTDLEKEVSDKLQKAVHDAQGKVYKTLRNAEAYSYERVSRSRGEGLRFSGQLKANQASPEIYQHLQRLLVLEDALPSIRKYVVVADKDDQEIYIFDLSEPMATGLIEGMDMESIIKE